MINPRQLERHVIYPVLQTLEYYSENAADFMLGIAAAESACGSKIVQDYDGPGLGIYQCEPATHDDIIRWATERRPELIKKLRTYVPQTVYAALPGNLYYATAICRLHWLRIPDPMPKAGDVQAQAALWKKYYNTVAGKGTEAEFIARRRRVLG